jgi:Fis family transcriptional regulator, factor for inversion stimulation protein
MESSPTRSLKEPLVTPVHSQSDNLFVANLNHVSLEKLVRSKLEVILKQHHAGGRVQNLYAQVMEQVERPMIELALTLHEGNQIRTAELLGINRNTLRKKISAYKIKTRPRVKQ